MDDKPAERIEYWLDWETLMEVIREHGAMIFGHPASLRELADYLSVSAATLSRMDRGYIMDIKTLTDICSVMDEPPGRFFKRRVWELKDGE